MRVLLTPYIQHDLGVVLFKPGSEALKVFHQGRVVIMPVPESFKTLPAGLLPIQIQQIANDNRLTPFLTDNKVIAAAGGIDSLIDWLTREKTSCQWTGDNYCHKELTVRDYPPGAIHLCWHHDTEFTGHSLKRLGEIATNNVIEWVLDVVRRDLLLPIDHQLTIPELCWWSVLKEVFNELPESIARRALKLPEIKESRIIKEMDIRPYDDRAIPIINSLAHRALEHVNVLDKPIKTLEVDPEPPASFMLRPKLKTWKCEKYTQWVKTQPCVCCGQQADDPHHIISAGLGGVMGGKPHDLFTIPLCRIHHNELHANVNNWETKYGPQIEFFIRVIDRALGMGVLA